MGTVITVLLVVVVVVVLLRFGYLWAQDQLAAERTELAQRRASLDAEWRALENTRRVRTVFLDAHRAMRDEARRHGL